MPRYMMFIKHSESYRDQEIPPALMQAMGTFVQESMKSGVLVETSGLQPTKNGFRVSLEKGKLTVTDGPFAESKEVVGGFAICECRDNTHALEVAKQFMELHRKHWPAFEGTSEVRPMEVFE
ncbi:MAG TPA: YciI family protein [Gemmatimonadaceae bacterium]|nr:YciI family protein [Gemmatimonadaceae bacterium]